MWTESFKTNQQAHTPYSPFPSSQWTLNMHIVLIWTWDRYWVPFILYKQENSVLRVQCHLMVGKGNCLTHIFSSLGDPVSSVLSSFLYLSLLMLSLVLMRNQPKINNLLNIFFLVFFNLHNITGKSFFLFLYFSSLNQKILW